MKKIILLATALLAQTVFATGYPISYSMAFRQSNQTAPPTLFGASSVWAWDAAVPLQFSLSQVRQSCAPGSCSSSATPISLDDLSNVSIALRRMELTKNNDLQWPPTGRFPPSRFKGKHQIKPSEAEAGFFSIPGSVNLSKACYQVELQHAATPNSFMGVGVVCLQ